jgi:hypothetical protein
MKGKDFAQLLTDFGTLLDDDRAVAWRAIPSIFEQAPTRSVVTICSVLSGLQLPEHGSGSRLQEMLGLISALKSFLGKVAAKKAVINDLKALEAALAPFGQVPTSDFADAAIQRLREQVTAGSRSSEVGRDDLVRTYLHRLEEALGDHAYPASSG